MSRTNMLFCVSSACLCVVLSGCQISYMDGYSFSFTGKTVEERQTGEIPGGTIAIQIENKFGNVEVVTSDDGSSGWEWTGKVWAETDELADLFLDELEMTSSLEDGTYVFTLHLPEPDDAFNGVRSDLIVTVPAEISVTSKNAHGNTRVVGVNRSVSTKNSHGDTIISDLGGSCEAENSHGNVTVKNVNGIYVSSSHGNVTLANSLDKSSIKNSHGRIAVVNARDLIIDGSHTSIDLRNALGNIEAKTSHAKMIVSDVKGSLELKNRHGRISAKQIEGNVRAETTHASVTIVADAVTVDAKSSHGDVNISLVNPDFADIKAKSSHGDVTLTLPASAKANLKLDGGRQNIEVDSSTDGAPVELSTSHGRISVRSAK